MGIKGQPFVDPVVDVPVARPPGQFEYLCQNEPVWFRVPVSDPDPVVEPEAVAKVDWIEPARVRSLPPTIKGGWGPNGSRSRASSTTLWGGWGV